MVAIEENVFYIIIAIIALVAIIAIILQWRKVREARRNVSCLEKQDELLPKSQQERLDEIRVETSKLMNKVDFMYTGINERFNRLEFRTETEELQKIIEGIEKKKNK